MIASVNGLSFATTIPLIGVDGLDACLEEFGDPAYPNTVVLLNAFNKEVYFAMQQKNQLPYKGYAPITDFINELHQLIPEKQIRFLGNATDMYRALLQESFGNQAYIPDPLPSYCSVQQIGIMGLRNWHNKQGLAQQLLPLYLKKHPAQQ